MPLHPQCRRVLDELAGFGNTPLEQSTPEQARAERARIADYMYELAGPAQPVGLVEDRTIPGPAQPIPIRVYHPAPGTLAPALVYFHGGGWVLGNLDIVDRPCRTLANESGCVVVSVDYRLAPEHPFPAGLEDAFAATRHVADHAAEFGADARRIAVGGDSAGGNLAAAVALMARDRGEPSLTFQLLVYPVTDYDDDRPSMREYADGHLLTRAGMEWFWGHYVNGAEEGRQSLASPLNFADLRGLPPAMVITAECDPLRDQGEAYAERLREAGVRVTLKRYAGAIHAFFQMGAAVAAGAEALEDAARALREQLVIS